MSKTLKQPKRKEVSRVTFVKGTLLQNHEKNRLIQYLQQNRIAIYIKSAGANNDDTEFWEIRVDGIVA